MAMVVSFRSMLVRLLKHEADVPPFQQHLQQLSAQAPEGWWTLVVVRACCLLVELWEYRVELAQRHQAAVLLS